jgi:hypothetical protein
MNKPLSTPNDYQQIPEGLTDEQARILAALLASPTKTAAAKALGIARSTLYLHLQDETLKVAYEQLRAAAIQDATDSLMNVAEGAVAVLHSIAHDPGVTANVRVAAASKLIDMAVKAHELQDILSRLETLEREVA